jgi:hypothetical protein
MGLSNIAVIAAISLSGLWPSSCSKAPSQQRTQAAGTNAAAIPSKTKELGVIQLTNHYETQIDLGKGQSCTITPRLLDRHNLQLTLSFGTKTPLESRWVFASHGWLPNPTSLSKSL